ncbi:hypothetical protein VTL71DRAFT_14259 [Oculimacula yallundae]|uniref:PAC domain-containing protein n=1 Tax=Oculimacula yallundae TaxID=86028 RepID=A0ABR4CIL7_9HELO
MEPASSQSSPTISHHRVSKAPHRDHVDLRPLSMNPYIGNTDMAHRTDRGSSTTEDPEAVEGTEFFDLHPPAASGNNVSVEDVMKRLFSAEHLHFILGDHLLFFQFSTFLNRFRPRLVPTLIRYLEMRKAMKAIEYANAVAKSIRWPSHTDYCKFSRVQAAATDIRFEDYAARELLLLCSEALPAFVAHTLIGVVSDCVTRDITGQGIPIMRDLVGNLAEVYCLTDPSVHDNPIIFASEEFHRTTQYGTSYAINSNCRFLQGPGTDKDTTLRLAKAISLGQESNEILLNYRRDGTPFVNLLMCSPLYDDKGVIRYFIGAQIDVTGLVIDGLGIESFRALLQDDETKRFEANQDGEYGNLHSKLSVLHPSNKSKDSLSKLQELSMMFSQEESDVANRNSRGGDDSTEGSIRSGVPTSVKHRGQSKRVIGGDEVQNNGLGLSNLNINNPNTTNMSLPGVYKHYLLVRPYPSLQIIFVSPSLRIPGLLRTHLFTKLGGPTQTISALESAFRDGASVTAKVLWLPKSTHVGERGRGPAEIKPRFIRCTPLLGSDDRVGVWMVILVPVDGEPFNSSYGRRDPMYDMVDETAEERMRLAGGGSGSRNPSRAGSMRRAPSIDMDADGGFGLKRSRTPRVGNVAGKGEIGESDERQLYADYLRSSSSTGSREGVTPRKTKENFASLT